MHPDTARRRSVREQTDESLRVEREKADEALGQELAAIDEAADAVITLARDRADAVLAAARARTDEQAESAPCEATSPKIIAKERGLADEALRQERAVADDILREERAEHLEVLSNQRGVTDKDLSSERTRSDDVLATRDEFLGIVSHDLRHMLNAMVGFAALISKEVSQDNHVEAVTRHAERIQRSGARMNRLIGDLADVVSIEAGRLAVRRELGDPTSVVTEAVETFQALAAASRVSLQAEVVAPMPPTPFDTARILQVLTNLLSNAIKFTPAGGTVVVRVEGSDDNIVFSVSDTGVGIAPDQLGAVFVRFMQLTKADRRGIGLGLYISKCIVQGHGGRIWAEARPGGGSIFKFTLPIQER